MRRTNKKYQEEIFRNTKKIDRDFTNEVKRFVSKEFTYR